MVDDILDALGLWCRRDMSVSIDTVNGVHIIRVGILHLMMNISNMSNGLSIVGILQVLYFGRGIR